MGCSGVPSKERIFFSLLDAAGDLGKEGVVPTQRGRSPLDSSCTCSYADGHGPAIGPHTGRRCWPLLAGVWRAIAPVLGGDANTVSAGYVCLETESVDGESDFHAAMLAAFAFAALLGLPSFFAVVCPGAATLFLGGENDFYAAMGWPSCFAVESPAVPATLSGGMLCYAALSQVLRCFWVPAAMLFWAALSVLFGVFVWGCLVPPMAAENTRLFILLEMVQVVFCAENWVPGSSSQEDEAALFEWVEVESYEPEPPCTMINNTSYVFDLAGEARRRGWCEHELMYHIFEFGVPEGLRNMEAHMKALASVGEGSETVLQGRRILELAAEEDEANSVVFPGGVFKEEDNSVNESSSSSWQWPWVASGEIHVWNPLLGAMADVVAGSVLDDMVSEVEMGRVALTCHFSFDMLCSEMQQPQVFLPQVLSLDGRR